MMRTLSIAAAGSIVALAAISSARAQSDAQLQGAIEQRCEKTMQSTPNDLANLSSMRVALPDMCNCIATAITPRLLNSDIQALVQLQDYPMHLQTLWEAARGYCATTLRPKQ
jgi:hypothetical protein